MIKLILIYKHKTQNKRFCIHNFQAEHKRIKRAGGKGKTYPEDTPEFDRANVSLDFPDELFNKSFATLTNVSKSISRLIMVSNNVKK